MAIDPVCGMVVDDDTRLAGPVRIVAALVAELAVAVAAAAAAAAADDREGRDADHEQSQPEPKPFAAHARSSGHRDTLPPTVTLPEVSSRRHGINAGAPRRRRDATPPYFVIPDHTRGPATSTAAI